MPFDSGLRQSIYEAVNSACKAHPHTVVVGDMNAALFPHDRSCSQRTTLDRQHEQFVADSKLQPTDTSHGPFSFTVRSKDCDANIRSSRIYDVLVSQSICGHLRTPCTTVLEATDDSDHLPLLATLELSWVLQALSLPSRCLPLKQTLIKDQNLSSRSRHHSCLNSKLQWMMGMLSRFRDSPAE